MRIARTRDALIAAMFAFVTLVGVLAAVPALAAPPTASVSVTGSAFSPKTVSVAVGGTVTWTFNGTAGQSVVGNPDLGNGFGSGPEPVGATYPFRFAQAGLYNYKDALSGAKGRVSVPLGVSPSVGTTATNFTITFGASPVPPNLVSDVQVSFCPTNQTCALDWADLYPNDPGTSHVYTPAFGPGTYSFRNQVINTNTGAFSTSTPTSTIIVRCLRSSPLRMSSSSPCSRGLPAPRSMSIFARTTESTPGSVRWTPRLFGGRSSRP